MINTTTTRNNINPSLSTIHKEGLMLLKEIDRICKKYNIKYSLFYGTLLGAIRHNGYIPWDDDIDIVMTRDSFKKFTTVVNQELCSNFFYQSIDTNKYYFTTYSKIRSNNIKYVEPRVSFYPINHGVWVDIFVLDKILPNSKKYKFKLFLIKLLKLIRISGSLIPSKKYSFIKNCVAEIINNFNQKTFKYNPIYKFIARQEIKLAESCNNPKGSQLINLTASHSDMQISFKEDEILKTKNQKFENLELPIPVHYNSVLTKCYGDYMTPISEDKRFSHSNYIMQ